MASISHRVGIKAPASEVYAALSTVQGVSDWWTRETSGTSAPGGVVDVRFTTPAGDELGRIAFEVVTLDPGERVRWRFKSGPEEWIDTHVTFDLAVQGEYTIVRFSHDGWREPVEFMAHCSMKWATFLLSLRDLVEHGTGRPSPHDVKIDNWN